MESYIHLYKTNSEFTEAYNSPNYKEPWLSLTEEGMKVNYNKPKLTAITFDNITWVTDVPATGGTATKDNCSFKVYGNYDNGISVDISSDATVTGELVVPSSTEGQRHEAGKLTLTASYSGFTATGNVTAYQAAPDFSTEPLTFKILSDGTIRWTASNAAITKTIKYKVNDGGWTSITSNKGSSAPTINVAEGDKIQFRGNNRQYSTNYSNYNSFSGSTALFEAEGNIMSLIYGDDFKNKLTISSTYAFADLFKNCTKLVSAKNLVLPATTLANYCYQYMFNNCTSLTTAPELPATTLAEGCYQYMLEGCTSLITAPELPATTLAKYCYEYMFESCTSLTTAPELPATDLVNYCYRSMFQNCKSLTTAPELSATRLADSCYYYMFQYCTSLTAAPVLPATTLANNCYSYMFQGCTSLTAAPTLPATTLATSCYSYMFQGCTSLTTAPALPANTLVMDCYSSMFESCTSLTTAPELPATTLANNCYSYMFYGTNVLPDCSNIDFASSTVVASGGLKGLFSGTKVTDNDLERLLPKNDNGRYYLPVITLTTQCYSYMFEGCTSLTTAPALPATTLADSCYAYMFNGCTSLATAPVLPATTLADYCYQNMFRDCTSLNYIKCLATDISASNCTGSWVDGVASTGTFVKASSMTSWTTGTSGIPEGWTAQDA